MSSWDEVKTAAFFFCSKLLWLSGLGTGLSPRRLGFVSHMEHNITLVTDHFLFLSVYHCMNVCMYEFLYVALDKSITFCQVQATNTLGLV